MADRAVAVGWWAGRDTYTKGLPLPTTTYPTIPTFPNFSLTFSCLLPPPSLLLHMPQPPTLWTGTFGQTLPWPCLPSVYIHLGRGSCCRRHLVFLQTRTAGFISCLLIAAWLFQLPVSLRMACPIPSICHHPCPHTAHTGCHALRVGRFTVVWWRRDRTAHGLLYYVAVGQRFSLPTLQTNFRFFTTWFARQQLRHQHTVLLSPGVRRAL